jgi:uncharacterized protein with LGFP repeats
VAAAAVLVGMPGPAGAAPGDPLPAGASVVGTVVRAAVELSPDERADAGPHEADAGSLLTWVDSGETDPPVRVPTADLADVPVGSVVEVTVGGLVDDGVAGAEQVGPAREVLGSEVLSLAPADPGVQPSATVTNHVTVALVAPAGTVADGTTPAQVAAQVSGPVAQFWSGQTDGAVTFGVAATHGWLTTTAGCGDPQGLWAEVARRVGFTAAPGRHLLLYLPRTAASCSFGLAEIGSDAGAGGDAYVRSLSTSVIAHELGHNLGLLHSGKQQCLGAVEFGTCTVDEYGDLYDVMGASWDQIGSLNAVQAAQLGALPDADVATVPASGGTFTLLALSASSGTRALALTGPSGQEYLLEYRQPTGQDAYLGTTANWVRLPAGVLLHRVETDSTSSSSMLLDATPSADARYATDASSTFTVGTPAALACGGVTITVTSASSTAASVRISATTSPIAAAYTASGGATGPLGAPSGDEECLPDGATVRSYERGTIYWTPVAGSHVVRAPIEATYEAVGGPAGLGYPVTDRYPTAGGGWTQQFQRGGIHFSPATGAHAVIAEIAAAYNPLRGESGVLGYPVTDRYPTAGGGWTQQFQRGGIHFSPATGAHAVIAEIAAAYNPLRGESGVLGYPVTDRYPTAGGGWTQQFQRGGIHYSPATGAHAVIAEIAAAYNPLWGESGVLGYPVTDRYPTAGGGWTQQFQRGGIHFSPATGAHAVIAELASAYNPLWGESGVLGYPVTDRYPTAGGGWTQQFQRGGIHYSRATGAHAVIAELAAAYNPLWGESGVLGYPVTDRYPTAGGGWTQQFQRGGIHYSPATGAHAVTAEIAAAYNPLRGESGVLGYPVTDRYPVRGGVEQRFQRGLLTATGGPARLTRF